MRKFKRVFAGGDLHCGHRVGLTHPDFQSAIPGERYHRIQWELWRWFQETVKGLQPFDIAIINGDAIDGKGYRSGSAELITADWQRQRDIAKKAIDVIGADKVMLTHGCLTKGHRILTGDLKYVPVEQLCPGDKIFGFSESLHPETRRRYWESGKVISNKPAVAEVYRISLSDGTTLEATPNHPFLVKNYCGSGYKWATVEHMYQRICNDGRVKNGIKFPRYLDVWEPRDDFCSGYLSGFFDGEGCLSLRRKPRRGPIPETHFTLMGYQRKNAAMDKVVECLKKQDFQYSITNKDIRRETNCYNIRICGGTPEVLRFLGQNRPGLLLPKVNIDKDVMERADRLNAEQYHGVLNRSALVEILMKIALDVMERKERG